LGQNIFREQVNVIAECKQTTKYFNSIEINFVTEDILSINQKVAIPGIAGFLRDGKRINFVNAVDIYNFDQDGMIKKISSYCVSEK